ncbi:MAG: response regulator transcription factor [Acidobacteria bacterium]|nr:response regulator transcription factor [Acidobacteriota bacterium]
MRDRGTARPRVLVVEDDPATSEFIAEVLEAEGFDAMRALDGESALGVMARRAPDAVVLDICLPRMDGFSVLRSMRADPETRQTPVLTVTALGDEESAWRAWQAGCDFYLTKPFDPDELLRALGRLLSWNPPRRVA